MAPQFGLVNLGIRWAKTRTGAKVMAATMRINTFMGVTGILEPMGTGFEVTSLDSFFGGTDNRGLWTFCETEMVSEGREAGGGGPRCSSPLGKQVHGHQQMEYREWRAKLGEREWRVIGT